MNHQFFRKSVYAAAALGTLAMLAGCNDSDNTAKRTADASSQLDKEYIPALFYSNISPVPNEAFARNAQATFNVLESGWDTYTAAMGTKLHGVDLTPYLTEAEANITSATQQIGDVITAATYPADITDAHNALENVRDVLSDMRSAIDVDYFMDYMTEAHHAMEPVSGAAATYEPGDDDAAYCAALESSLGAFTTSWSAVASKYSATTTANLYALGSEKNDQLVANLNALSAILNNIDGNMTDCTANIDDVDAEADKIKGTFVKAFLAFGDFITPFADDMIAMELAFVPALYCTNNPPDFATTCGGLTGTSDYLDTLEAANDAFQAHYPVIPSKLDLPGSINWKSDFTTVNTSIDDVQTIAAGASAAADLVPAHDLLEGVRTAMYHLRSTYENYDFIMDRVTDYHNDMEPIAIAVKPLSDPSEVNQTVKDAISAALPGAMSAMQTLESDLPALDLTAFGYDAAWLDTQNSSIASQLANLKLLQSGLSEDNATVIYNAAKQVKPLFVPFFKTFGSF